jgi:hypothetical protein
VASRVTSCARFSGPSAKPIASCFGNRTEHFRRSSSDGNQEVLAESRERRIQPDGDRFQIPKESSPNQPASVRADMGSVGVHGIIAVGAPCPERHM